MSTKEKDPAENNEEQKNFPGYKPYPADEDIYRAGTELKNIDPEDLLETKAPNEAPGMPNEKDFEDDLTGEDLDVPGNEDDEDALGDGNEDEENNYYSLGGDNHNDLEENQGE